MQCLGLALALFARSQQTASRAACKSGRTNNAPPHQLPPLCRGRTSAGQSCPTPTTGVWSRGNSVRSCDMSWPYELESWREELEVVEMKPTIAIALRKTTLWPILNSSQAAPAFPATPYVHPRGNTFHILYPNTKLAPSRSQYW
ncbi:hypothetical protein T440DRAFT_532520 [Plenodomus tracheiphilus IPT5]|uniref:Secreted protein n=1 Tax=Plenodomus tracheiphilus IPT5 TaxID=1408161 RepID=A0A6A7B472_9PLEO|nr:hypothetical protein T440DRAFT_532520 [Plenodomus tracheiphilus IPT5]